MSQVFVFLCLLSVLFSGCSKSESPAAVDVSVERAEFNQPSIEVRSAPAGTADAVLVETQGYEQAKDRLLQMDVLRRLGRGQIADLFGAQSPQAESQDRLAYGLGMPQAVDKKDKFYRENYSEAYGLLEAFSRGVNRRIAELSEKDGDTLRLYRQLTRDLSYVPRLWEPADTLAVAQNIAFYLSSRLQSKLSMGVISMTSDDPNMPMSLPNPSKLTENLDTRSVSPTFIMDADASQNPWLKRLAAKGGAKKIQRKTGKSGFTIPSLSCIGFGFPIPECGQEVTVGSNSFVAGRSFTGTKDVLIGNDPHLLLALPMTFYEGAYDSTPAGGTFKVRGFNLPGIPLVLIGHNKDLGWAFTNLAADVDDVYLEFLRGEKNDEVSITKNGKSRTIKLQSDKFPLQVRNRFGGLESKEVVVRSIEGHGPIFTDHEPNLQKTLHQAEETFGFSLAASYKWVGHEPTGEFAAIIGLGRATSYHESVAALKEFGAGAQNVVIGTRSGDIGYYAHGKFPVRPYISDQQPPFVPVVSLPGQDKEWSDKWREDIPQLYNPAADRIVTANNDPFGHSANPRLTEWEDYFSVWFSPGVRAARITSILDSLKGSLSLENANQAQYDHKDLLVDAYLKLLGPELEKGTLKLNAQAKAFADRLVHWDATMKSNLEEPVMAQEWIEQLLGAYMQKHIALSDGDFAKHVRTQTTLLVRTTYHKLADFLAGDAEARKGGLELLEASLHRAAREVAELPAESRSWGALHRLEFANALSGVMPSFSSLPFPRQGSAFTVDLSHGPVGPGFRMLMTVGEEGINAVAAVPGGNYASSNTRAVYSELVPWLRGKYRPLVPFRN